MISEIFYSPMFTSTGAAYRWARYMELYNNSDTTVYLDGKLLVFGSVPVSGSDQQPCSMHETWRLDQSGIWSEWHVAVPGGGRNYPLKPGEAALIATDAIDHREFWPGAGDLSRANFEGVGTNDVDNPAVPNLVDVGLRRWEVVLGHGWYPTGPGVLAVTDPVNVAELRQEQLPNLPRPDMRLIPAERILDLVTVISNRPPDDPRAFCDPVVHASFDRRPSLLYSERTTAAVHRRILARLGDGRVILQRTKTSANDLFESAQSPGAVP